MSKTLSEKLYLSPLAWLGLYFKSIYYGAIRVDWLKYDQTNDLFKFKKISGIPICRQVKLTDPLTDNYYLARDLITAGLEYRYDSPRSRMIHSGGGLYTPSNIWRTSLFFPTIKLNFYSESGMYFELDAEFHNGELLKLNTTEGLLLLNQIDDLYSITE